MPDRVPIRVCVVALMHGQSTLIAPPDLNALAKTASDYDVQTKGHVYGDSPDDWCPFVTGERVLDYLGDADFNVNSLSGQLVNVSRPVVLDALITKVDLYVIDPFFLALEAQYPGLANRFDGAIRQSNKPFCILLPSRLPMPLRERLAELCASKLPLLKVAFEQEGRGEWEAESALRLLAFLRRIRRERQQADRPPPVGLDMATTLFRSLGVQELSMPQSPKIGTAV